MKGARKTQSLLLVVMLLVVSAFISNKSACEVKALSCVQPPEGLISWWAGDGDATDLQEINDGVLQNGATFASGMVDQAFSFDGVDDFVEVSDNGSLDLNGDFTFDAWINPDTLAGVGIPPTPIINKYNFSGGIWGNASYHLSIVDGGKIRFSVTCGTMDMFLDTASAVVSTGVWTHVAAVYRQSVPAMEVYINGVLQSGTTTGSCSLINQNNVPIRIGKRIDGASTAFFDGLVDEVEIFDRAISAAEVQSIFGAGSAGKCKTISVEIDIKPGSDPNCFNNDGHGVIPVAILTTTNFDASSVDPSSVLMDGAAARVKGKSGNTGSLEDVDGDGDLDLVLQIIDNDSTYQEGDTTATLTGLTWDGQEIQGQDSICIVP